jgi:hypothetical protein
MEIKCQFPTWKLTWKKRSLCSHWHGSRSCSSGGIVGAAGHRRVRTVQKQSNTMGHRGFERRPASPRLSEQADCVSPRKVTLPEQNERFWDVLPRLLISGSGRTCSAVLLPARSNFSHSQGPTCLPPSDIHSCPEAEVMHKPLPPPDGTPVVAKVSRNGHRVAGKEWRWIGGLPSRRIRHRTVAHEHREHDDD